jgi:hypothetical protein
MTPEPDRYGIWRLDALDVDELLKVARQEGGDRVWRKMLKHQRKRFEREARAMNRRVDALG